MTPTPNSVAALEREYWEKCAVAAMQVELTELLAGERSPNIFATRQEVAEYAGHMADAMLEKWKRKFRDRYMGAGDFTASAAKIGSAWHGSEGSTMPNVDARPKPDPCDCQQFSSPRPGSGSVRCTQCGRAYVPTEPRHPFGHR